MGLFKELVLLPLAPVRGTAWVTEQLVDEADRRLYDEDNIKREMIQLEIDHDDGKIGDEERAAIEADLMDRLAVARERQAEERELGVEPQAPREERPDG
ncbi:gas vesicle protein [Thermoleophilia bacterium SCSIO 60948]|nr:gas vesicle protein [Thermoleophilia bacterium SCSIO 60948]